RVHHPFVFSGTCALLLLASGVARADESPEDASIGTTPSRPKESFSAAPPPAAPTVEAKGEAGSGGLFDDDGEDRAERRRTREAPLASSPPTDWAVLHAGLRPHLGSFYGI